MSRLVVDSSVAIKWFLPEVHSVEARRWRFGPDELHVPEAFLQIEVANILRNKLLRNEIGRRDANDAFLQFATLPVIRHPDIPLIPAAFDIAVTYQRSVYDSLYLALAERLDGQMLTADLRLINALAGTPLAQRVRHVGDFTP